MHDQRQAVATGCKGTVEPGLTQWVTSACQTNHTSLGTLAKELLLSSLKQVQSAGCEVGHTMAVLKMHGTATSPYDWIHARSQ
jgi:hypothetical protein